jgi:hypothetical protein
MAIVRMTELVIESMSRNLVQLRKPELAVLEAARPMKAFADLYNWMVPDTLKAQLDQLPPRYRPAMIDKIHIRFAGTSVVTFITASEINGYNQREPAKTVYALLSPGHQSIIRSGQPVVLGNISLSQDAMEFKALGEITEIHESIRDAYCAARAYADKIVEYNAETRRHIATLQNYLQNQPSLNKAVANMPAIRAFINPNHLDKMAERVERAPRKTSEPKAKQLPATPADSAMTELVMVAAQTRV